jgi:hypothetical protein
MFTILTNVIDSILWKKVIEERLELYGRRCGRRPTALEVRIQRSALRLSH